MTASYDFRPIGVVRSCFGEKFGIPRQPGLVPEAEAVVELFPPYDRPEAVEGLDGFSHVWLIFVFHGVGGHAGLTVRPPRLGGNRRLGVLASRSMFRPNPIGLSAVRLDGVEIRAGRARLRVSGVDLLDGSPILDVKPYLPYADSLPDARGGYAPSAPGAALEVAFTSRAQAFLAARPDGEKLRRLIEAVLSLDPRPAYRAADEGDRVYGMRLQDLDVRWCLSGGRAQVQALIELDSTGSPKLDGA
jgi:tRNA-Thr(GGU) m(6)t(6)A37 methyltransferase TsaA